MIVFMVNKAAYIYETLVLHQYVNNYQNPKRDIQYPKSSQDISWLMRTKQTLKSHVDSI